MKSIILCEGSDDLWFIGYYLHKSGNWMERKRGWKNYQIAPLDDRQEIIYMEHQYDSAAIWCVGGKDNFQPVISIIFDKFISNFPQDPIDSLVILRDRDFDTDSDCMDSIADWVTKTKLFDDKIRINLGTQLQLENKVETVLNFDIDGYDICLHLHPIVIPFDEEGAIETVLMRSIQEQSQEGAVIVQEANQYIDRLRCSSEVGKQYLNHQRLILKARYSAVIAATNPDHSTKLFQGMVRACPWEKTDHVQKHFDLVRKAITSHNPVTV